MSLSTSFCSSVFSLATQWTFCNDNTIIYVNDKTLKLSIKHEVYANNSTVFVQLYTMLRSLAFTGIFFVLCGSSFADREKIFQGNFTTENAFDYEVSIKIIMERGSRICGGALISELAVLTAAHCTYGRNKFMIGWGSNELRKPLKSLTANVSIEHSEYRPWFDTHDIAIIKLPRKVNSYKINPVRLPTAWQNRNKFENTHAIIAGYGKTSNSEISLH